MFLPQWTLETPLTHSPAAPEAPRLDDRLAGLPTGAIRINVPESRDERGGVLPPMPGPERDGA